MRVMQNFKNNETGELHRQPVKLNLYSVIKRFLAWKRIRVWGFCPACNSDAPKLYDCKVCDYDTKSPFNSTKRKEYWNNWKLQDWRNNV